MSTRGTALAALCGLAVAGVQAQAPGPGEIAAWQVRDGIYMLVGEGGNTTMQIGDDGLLIVDTKLATGSDALLAAIRKISDEPIRYVINTHWHADHVGSNEAVAKAGSTIAGGNVSGAIADAGEGAAVIAHENVLVRMSGQDPSPPFEAWPTVTLFMPQKDLHFNGEAIEILHQPAAHTDGDSLVFFRRSDVVSTGDVFTTTGYPVIRPEDGGGIDGVIAALNHIIGDHGARRETGRRHARDPWSRPAQRRGRRRRVPRHGHDHPRPHQEHGRNGYDAAASAGREADGRLRRPLRCDERRWTTEQFVAAAYESLKND